MAAHHLPHQPRHRAARIGTFCPGRAGRTDHLEVRRQRASGRNRLDKGGYRPLLWRYRWDAKSQLTGLDTPDGERWEYSYDPFGRRISKHCTNRDKPGTDFHWNGDQLTEEIPVGADGVPVDENAIRWVYEPGSFRPLARYENGQLHYAYRARSLKPGTDGKPYNVYEVTEPITVTFGEAAPWFGYEGDGIQYELPDSVINLINNGKLVRL